MTTKVKEPQQAGENNAEVKRYIISAVSGVLLLLLYLLIYSFSAQDAETSGSLSQMISEKCVEIINSLSGGSWSADFMEGLAEYFEHPIRKLAHFSEYACMGVLVYVLWSQWMAGGRRLYLLVVGWVFVSAAVDEFHQLFVPGRYGCFADVLLDTAGGAAGLLICIGVRKLICRCKKKRTAAMLSD